MLLHHIIFAYCLAIRTAIATESEPQSPLAMSTDSTEPLSRPLNVLPPLFDTLLLQRSHSIFFDYLRETPGISRRIADLDVQTTLLVPSNKAVIALGWKPERGPPGSGTSDAGKIEISEESLNENVERWVGAHAIPVSVDRSWYSTSRSLNSTDAYAFR